MLGLLQQLDWVGRLNEDGNPRYVLLVDLASTQAAPLIDQLLLADTPHSQAVWARCKDWRLAELV